ncbi:MAG: peptidylprolyl isomerase [Salinivirgaceae bacterium]|nr:MAG: peptidylprolyl isomerase [Salinivirgaceae bacterium]
MSYRLIVPIFLFAFVILGCKSNYHEKRINSQMQKRQYDENLIIANRGLISRDSSKIVGILRARGWDMNVSETGLWYQVLDKGDGPKAQEGQVAELEYKLRLINNKLVYSSDSTGPLRFRISKGGVERGLEEGMLYLSEGDSARFILPPYMAHHLLGDQNKIPPRAIIIYEVRLNSLLN